MSTIKNHWSFFAALSVLLFTLLITLSITLSRNNFHLTYAVDDAFIHMAIAKNLAQNGVWGVTAAQFSSASSSPLWELLLAFTYRLFGVNTLAPLILNIIFASGLLWFVYHLLWKYQAPPLWRCLTLFALIFCTSLPALVLTGMEHTLHALLTVLFITYSAKALAQQPVSLPKWRLLAMLLVAARYEGMFTIAVVCLLLLLTQRRRGLWSALYIAVCGAAPIIFYGMYSLSQGWYFLPNSVMLKSSTFDLSQPLGILSLFGLRALIHMLSVAYIFVLVIGLVCLLCIRRDSREAVFSGWITLLVILLHMQFSQTGAFYRYEAYLIISALVALSLLASSKAFALPHWNTLQRAHFRHALVGVIVLIPLLSHGIKMLLEVPQAMTNNYQQQYQMAQFVQEYYNESGLALNDIGAVSYFSNIHLLDIVGLASLDVGRLTLEQNRQPPTAAQIAALARENNVTIAIVSEGWVDIPPEWIRIASWTITNNVIAASDTVLFYAINAAEAQILRANLRAYSRLLPEEVRFQIDE